MTNALTPDHTLDCRGTLCPMPIIRLRQELDKIEAGQVIKVLATDPASAQDMPAFARNTGHELLDSQSGNGVFQFLFRKSASS